MSAERRALLGAPRRGLTPGALPRSPKFPRAWLLVASAFVVAVALLTAIALGGRAGSAEPPLPTGTPGESAPAPTPSETPRSQPQQPAPQAPTGTATAATIPDKGPNTYVVSRQTTGATSERGRLLKLSVAVETGLPLSADQVALQIMTTLSDGRSWGAKGTVRFQLIANPHAADFVVYITTPATTDKLCAPLDTNGELSCQLDKRVVLNAERWTHGNSTYGTNTSAYRDYLANHEIGHFLGFGHVQCPRAGALASVMVQQTKGLGGCRPNPWPYP